MLVPNRAWADGLSGRKNSGLPPDAEMPVRGNTGTQNALRGACVPQLFAFQAASKPNALALQAGSASLTYWELDTRANQLAHHLRSLGAGPEVRVGLCFDRSLELVVDALAILKAGGAYLPLDPSYPTERLTSDRIPSGHGHTH